MSIITRTYVFLSTLALCLLSTPSRRRTERGGSGSVNEVVLIAGAIVVAGLVIAGIKAYVGSHMPK